MGYEFFTKRNGRELLAVITQDQVMQVFQKEAESKEYLKLKDIVSKFIKKGQTKEEIIAVGRKVKRRINELIKVNMVLMEVEGKERRYRLKKKPKKPIKAKPKKEKVTKTQKTLVIEDIISKPAKPKASKPRKPKASKPKAERPKAEKTSRPKPAKPIKKKVKKPRVTEPKEEKSTPPEKRKPKVKKLKAIKPESEPVKPAEIMKLKPEKPKTTEPKTKKPRAKIPKPSKRKEKKRGKPKDLIPEEIKEAEEAKKGVIRRGGIAEFMRKRTQLVGFDFGFHKHTQYAVEFIDNALDAIETAFWREKAYRVSKNFNFEWKQPDKGEGDEKKKLLSVLEDFDYYDLSKKTLVNQFHSFIEPVIDVIDREPIVIVRIRDLEKAESIDTTKDVRLYCFEIFDNGIGMILEDLAKFGLYLASSKSKHLKQTRGSQGFGASSAFSDAQNTSAKPIIAITRHSGQAAATVEAFYTTDKNEKKYELEPQEFRTRFQHGTYVKLFYQNVKYIRGYADEYIRQTALLNGHMNIIFIDPYGTTKIYPRKVLSFPSEPNYAKPHPSSVSIGDFQELFRNNPGADMISLLSHHFVRMSRNRAKLIFENANKALGTSVNIISVEPKELDDRQLRALHRNLVPYTNCFQRSTPDEISKLFEENTEANIDIFLKKQFDDTSGVRIKKIIAETKLPKKKIGDVDKEEIKFLQDKVRDIINCPYSISFAKFKSIAKEENSNFVKTLAETFCSMSSNSIRKIVEKTDEVLGNKNLKTLPASSLKKKEITLLHAELEKIAPSVSLVDFTKILKSKENASKTVVSIIRNDFKEIKGKTREDIIEGAADSLGFASVNDKPLKELTNKELKTLYDEMMELPKCPASITVNNLKEIMQSSKTKQLPTALKRKFIKLSNETIEDILDKANDSLGGSSSLEMLDPAELDEEQMNALYSAFISEKYLAPPTDTVVPVQSENLVKVIKKEFNPAFCQAETRNPTSGKGLAFGVEVAIAYGGDIKPVSRSTDVLFRFVNRTPKLRDNSDCAIWKAAQEVNWKNYKLERFDNGLPKGRIKLIVNISGPFVHVMFKSQSKQALADDENLDKEIRLGLEQVGRKLKDFITKRDKKKRRAKRASLLIRNVKTFAESLYNILKDHPKYKGDELKLEKIERKLSEPIKREVEKDIISVLTSRWEHQFEIMEDIGITGQTSKTAKEMIDNILKDLVKRGIVLTETVDEDGIKRIHWKLAREVEEEEEEEIEEPEIITIPGEAEPEEELEEEITTPEDKDEELDVNGDV